jgi:hypothetical protein
MILNWGKALYLICRNIRKEGGMVVNGLIFYMVDFFDVRDGIASAKSRKKIEIFFVKKSELFEPDNSFVGFCGFNPKATKTYIGGVFGF